MPIDGKQKDFIKRASDAERAIRDTRVALAYHKHPLPEERGFSLVGSKNLGVYAAPYDMTVADDGSADLLLGVYGPDPATVAASSVGYPDDGTIWAVTGTIKFTLDAAQVDKSGSGVGCMACNCTVGPHAFKTQIVAFTGGVVNPLVQFAVATVGHTPPNVTSVFTQDSRVGTTYLPIFIAVDIRGIAVG